MDATKLWPGTRLKTRVAIAETRTDLVYAGFFGPKMNIPVGTEFKVGSVHGGEKWADLEATFLHPVKLRMTFEEIARFFDQV